MRRFLAAAATLVLVLLASPIAVSLWMDRPVRGPIQFFLFHDDTRYAPKYSERIFNKLRTGMTNSTVENLLGLPLEIYYNQNGRIIELAELRDRAYKTMFPDLPPGSQQHPTEIVYSYSQPGKTSGHWFVRAVVFSPNGNINKITREFYAD